MEDAIYIILHHFTVYYILVFFIQLKILWIHTRQWRLY